jgi:hypothetical protein
MLNVLRIIAYVLSQVQRRALHGMAMTHAGGYLLLLLLLLLGLQQ